jgi:osmotically-inducible protein OsmY
MRRLSVRRSNGALEYLLAAASVGLGVAAGFFLRGAVGGVDRRRIRSFVGEVTGQFGAPPAESPRQATNQIRAALVADPDLGEIEFQIVPVRIGLVELHGWVPSRAARTRALLIARGAAPATEITNRLRVRGEDDHPQEATTEEERQPA